MTVLRGHFCRCRVLIDRIANGSSLDAKLKLRLGCTIKLLIDGWIILVKENVSRCTVGVAFE